MDYSPPGSSVREDSPSRILEWLPCPPPGDLPSSEIEHRSPTLQADSLPSESPGKPKYLLEVAKFPIMFHFTLELAQQGRVGFGCERQKNLKEKLTSVLYRCSLEVVERLQG